MFRVFKSELYKAVHNLPFCAMFLIFAVLSLGMTGMGVGSRDAHQVLVYHSPVNESYTSAIQAVIASGYFAKYDTLEETFLIATEAEPLLQPGGTLHSEYGWLLTKSHESKQYIEDTYYPADAEHVQESWRFDRLLNDDAAIALLGILFSVYFFGQDFTRRGFSAYILAGIGRPRILAGKFCAYLLAATLFSLVLATAAIATFVPNVLVLGSGYVMRCIATRLMVDLGFLCLTVIFPFIFRDVIKSVGAGILFSTQFLSNKAIVDLHVLDAYLTPSLWTTEFSAKAFFPALLTTVAIFIAAFTGANLLFRRISLK
ncbi:hypothetical protein [Gorillibacterium sp. sgz500922]|uniref:hypothetical protein n=1 Tax=Gorillibacterium sp. sgz500922 TaxID=3446694 RepID=UPI003F66A480